MFSIVVHGFPLDSSNRKQNEFIREIENAIIRLRQLKICRGDIRIHLSQDLNTFTKSNGILLTIYSRVTQPSLNHTDKAMLGKDISNGINKLLPGTNIEIHFF